MLNLVVGSIPFNSLSLEDPLFTQYFPSFPDLDPTSMTPTRLVAKDPVTESTMTLDGQFDFSSEAALAGSSVTALAMHTSGGGLLLGMDGFSVTVAQFESLDFGLLAAQLGGVNATLGPANDFVQMPDLVGSAVTNDVITGGDGSDTIAGGAGNDYIQGNMGNDSIMGGLGSDELRGGKDDDVVRGGAGQDFVQGALGNDELRGGQDADTLFAGQGNDTLFGGAANDFLDGKAGSDLLTGGANADRFSFSNAPDGVNFDTITDFEAAHDSIVLDALAFSSLSGLPKGLLPATNLVVGSGASAQDANDYLLYDTTTHILSYDADANGAGAALEVAMLGNGASLSAGDIVIA
jgi:Ca2+-binding RTX toxin-like protein